MPWVSFCYLLRRDRFLLLGRPRLVETGAQILDVILQRREHRVLHFLQHAHESASQSDDTFFEEPNVLQVRSFVLAGDVQCDAEAGQQALGAHVFEFFDGLELGLERVHDEGDEILEIYVQLEDLSRDWIRGIFVAVEFLKVFVDS